MKRVVAVFAHPDDEAFGPSGTLAKLGRTHEVHILCATDGDARGDMEETRARELRRSPKIIGAKKVYFLGFGDGDLSNNLYHRLAEKIRLHLIRLKPETVITFEPRGISGHIDHVAVTYATTFVVQKLRFVKNLFYFCIDENQRKLMGDYFIYFPPGYKRSDIDLAVDVSQEWMKKVQAIRAHQSQRKDGVSILKTLSKLPKEEYFLKWRR